MRLGGHGPEDTHAGEGRGSTARIGCATFERAVLPRKRNLAASGLDRRGRASTESFRLQIGSIFERMPVTAEVSSLAPAVALLPGLPVFDSQSSARTATRTWVPG